MANTLTTKRGRSLTASPRKTPTARPFLSIPDDELVRHGDIAYEDGYADAREWGKDGFFINEEYCQEERERYLQGFNAGLRVYKVTWGE